MPSKNSIKTYVENGFYHIYNRGVEKRIVFEDPQDYNVFLKYISEVLSPADQNITTTKYIMQGLSLQSIRRPVKSYYGRLEMLAYCLMPNHFHFLIRQNDKDALEGLMRSLMTRYSMYFNKKYNRVGSLFQGRYKAVLVNEESYLLHLSRYIHMNPMEYSLNLENAHSSYLEYLGKRKTSWLHPDIVLGYFNNKVLPDFKKINSYKSFIQTYQKDGSEILGNLVLEA
jgi:REP element-mobilizing transposase RayT